MNRRTSAWVATHAQTGARLGRKTLALLLSLVLCLSLLPGAALAAENADSADTGKAIQLGTGGITGYADTNSYDYIYYGTWNNSPIKWRVLNDKTNTGADGLFLLSDALLGTGGFGDVYFDDTYPYSNTWQGSDAQSWCSSFYKTNLTATEQGAVLETTKSDEAFTSSTQGYRFSASVNILSSDKVFFLSAEEAENEEYGFTNDSARVVSYGTSEGVWWLRSPDASNSYYAGAVSKYGYIIILYVGGDWAARPAFNLNLNSVLFTSAAVGGKADAAVDENLTAVSDCTGSEWKLTLKDSSRSFSADVNGQTSVSAQAGGRVQITYSGAQTGDNEYVSVLLCDGNDNVLYYGTIAQNSESGTASVTIPDGLAAGNYTLKVFSEQCSGDKKTDYASDFASIELTVMPVEQFSLTPGGTYYFDLSGENIPGTVNTGNEYGAVSLPDTTLHYVPFTYAGTVNAYKLNEATITNEAYAQANRYDHSLFIADYAVTHTVSWDALNSAGLIFGKDYASGNIGFSMRVPSQGSHSVGTGDSERGTPKSNEWDAILNKDNSYIKNWSGMYSLGQDTADDYTNYPRRDLRTVRGYRNVRYQEWYLPAEGDTYDGFRPVLEVLNADELDADALKAVTLDLNGGTLGGSSDDIQIIVKNGSTFAAPASDGLTRPDEGTFFVWLGSDGNLYAPGDSVPAEVTELTVQWTAPTYSVTLETNGGTIADKDNLTSYTYGKGAALPTPSRPGYRFDGWYADADFSGDAVTAISATDSGDKTFYAKWTRRGSSSGSGSYMPSYTVTVEKSTNGSVSADRKTASPGAAVTITVTPDRGYTLETLTVTDRNGNEQKLTNKGGGKYSFAMPSSEVTVRATFMDDNTMLNFFVDVKASDYFYDAVLWAAQTGVTAGTDAVHFSPDQHCTRAQIVTFLWRAAGSPLVNYAMNMTDVSEDAYYAEAVRWALSEGVATGTTATTFSPGETCTRAQAVAFLFRYAAPEAVTLQELVSGFSDAASVPGYALSAMNWALAGGIVQGDGSRLLPNDSCTRAQIVTFLYRTLAK